MRGIKYGWGYDFMQDKRKSNKEKMSVEESINEPIEQDKKITTKRGSSTLGKERNTKNDSKPKPQKKATSNEVIKLESGKGISTIKEKEIIAKNTEDKVELKVKETVKKTSTRKSTVAKTTTSKTDKTTVTTKSKATTPTRKASSKKQTEVQTKTEEIENK